MSRPRVKLAPLGPEHAERMLAWMKDPEVAGNLGLKSEPTAEKTRAFVERAQDGSVAGFAVLHEGEHVGNVVLDEIDRRAASARLSIYLGRARARGIGTAAVELALEEAFGRLALHRVWLTVHEKNAAAIAVYRKTGFVVEGTLRDAFVLDGKRIASLLMATLATDPRRRAAT
jgi:RimJ/RimL family protein N-acetyltransferase